MKLLLSLFILISIIGCKNDSQLSPLPPEIGKSAPKNILYAAHPFERDYSTVGIDLKSCPNGIPTSQDLQQFPQTFNYTKGNGIVAIYPCYHGGEAESFSISPALPAGLTFSTKSGRIAGTPTQLRLTQNMFVITASNSVGSSSSQIRIQVLDRPPVLRYDSDEVFLESLNLPFSFFPTVTGGAVENFSISPTPDGFSFDSDTGKISGISNQAVAEETYTITASNSGGVYTSSFSFKFKITPILKNLQSGKDHSCVVLNNELKCWGGNSQGQLGVGDYSNRENLTSIINSPSFETIGVLSLGNGYSCSLNQRPFESVTDMSCWGVNSSFNFGASLEEDEGSPNFGQLNTPIPNGNYPILERSYLGALLKVVASKGEVNRNTLVLYGQGFLKDFGIYSAGDFSGTEYNVQQNSSNMTNIMDMDSGNDFSCSVNFSGTIYCWGINSSGQLGDGTTIASLDPVESTQFSFGNNQASSVHLGEDFACAVDQTGDVYCWGNNSSGQLGQDPNLVVNSSTALEVDNFSKDILKIKTGYNHSCTLFVDGTVSCWGDNEFGQLGNNTEQDSHIPVSVVVDNNGVFEPLAEVREISMGKNFSCALTESTEIYCWGINTENQLGSFVELMSSSAKKINNLF